MIILESTRDRADGLLCDNVNSEAGFSGQIVSDVGPISATFDDCSPDGKHFGLIGFIIGRDVLPWGAKSKVISGLSFFPSCYR
jgi:hypothetical protein